MRLKGGLEREEERREKKTGREVFGMEDEESDGGRVIECS